MKERFQFNKQQILQKKENVDLLKLQHWILLMLIKLLKYYLKVSNFILKNKFLINRNL